MVVVENEGMGKRALGHDKTFYRGGRCGESVRAPAQAIVDRGRHDIIIPIIGVLGETAKRCPFLAILEIAVALS